MKNKRFYFIIFMLIFILPAAGCSKKSSYYNEEYRLQYHFSPEKNWMNDPNGMVYYNGKYHLFYQYNPNGTIWGPMYWGHATSTDMVTWTHLPVALQPDNLGTIFSGSAVVDSKDTTGLFNGGSGIVALYTNDNKGLQQQSMAYSRDGGVTFNKYNGNPVIKNSGDKDFRDPKVFWHEATKKWVMVLAVGDKVDIYNSTDLKNWNYLSSFGTYDGCHGGVWECPDLLELPVDGNTNNKKWVLKVDVGDNAIGGGSGGQYFVGNFDGVKFTNDNSQSTILWVDYGMDFYAAQTWANATDKDGSRFWLGWMNNWKYAQLTPTEGWRGANSIPRKLSLKSFPSGIRLVQSPVVQLENLRYAPKKFNNVVIQPDKNILKNYSGDSYEIEAEFELGTAEEFGFKLRKSDAEETIVSYKTKYSGIYVDRSHSGKVLFNENFPRINFSELKPVNNKIKMHIFVDTSSVEVFGNDGEAVMTNLIFPDSKSKGIELFSKGGNVKLNHLEIYKLHSSWK
jgi:fructan beta-fructosidase